MEERDDGAGGGNVLRSVIRIGTAPLVGGRLDTFDPSGGGGVTGRGAKGDLYRTFGDGYTRAFELAVTPTLFGAAGYGLDRWLGIVPALTIVFALVAFLTLLARTWYGYVRSMEILEQAGPWANGAKGSREAPA